MAGITFETRPPYAVPARDGAGVRPRRSLRSHAAAPAALLRAGVPGAGLPGAGLARARAQLGELALPRSGGWSWRASVLVLALLLHPYLLVLALDLPEAERVHAAGTMSLLMVHLSLLASAVALKFDWRISGRAGSGWLTAALAFSAALNVPTALLAVHGADQGRYVYLVGATQVPVLLVVLALTVLGQRGARLPWNPLALGLTLGGLTLAARLVAFNAGLAPGRATAGAPAVVIAALCVAVAAAVAYAVLRTTTLPLWLRVRVVAFVGLVIAGRLASLARPHDNPALPAVALSVLGALLLVCGTATALRTSIRDNGRRLANLAHRAASAESSVRHGKEQLHELHATVAGVAQASRLLVQHGGPRGAQRRRLETLLDAEMSRLERMLSRRGTEPLTRLSVDAVLAPLVETQRTLGADVRFEPSGRTAAGRPDDVAEAVHILLSNAARHAPHSPVTITVAGRPGATEVRVTDTGPGVPAELRGALFTWGVRGERSPGQGIGLQLAKRLMLEQEGDLHLEDAGRAGGATFVLTLPDNPPGLP